MSHALHRENYLLFLYAIAFVLCLSNEGSITLSLIVVSLLHVHIRIVSLDVL